MAITFTMNALDLVKLFPEPSGYKDPTGKTKDELYSMLREVYDAYPEYNDPDYGGGDFDKMVLKFAIDDFFKLHYVAKAYRDTTNQ